MGGRGDAKAGEPVRGDPDGAGEEEALQSWACSWVQGGESLTEREARPAVVQDAVPSLAALIQGPADSPSPGLSQRLGEAWRCSSRPKPPKKQLLTARPPPPPVACSQETGPLRSGVSQPASQQPGAAGLCGKDSGHLVPGRGAARVGGWLVSRRGGGTASPLSPEGCSFLLPSACITNSKHVCSPSEAVIE